MKLFYQFTWSQLAGLQRSFGSKALLALPLIAFAVAAVPDEWFRKYILANWRMHLVFWGALLFLAGQLLIWLRRPVEFAREKEVQAEISEIRAMSNFNSFKNRVGMLNALCDRYDKGMPQGLKPVELKIAKDRVAKATEATECNWEKHLPFVVTSQRRLRQYDYPRARLAAVLLLGGGAALMLVPTIVNIVIASFLLVRGYAFLLVRSYVS